MSLFTKKIRKLSAFIFILTFLFIFNGCAAQQEVPAAGATSDKILIMTSFYPIYIATINIARDIEGVSVTNMTAAQTGCLHDYSLTTGDLKKLSEGDIFVINGGGMESFMQRVSEQLPNLATVNASEGIEMIEENEEINPHVWVSVSGAIKQAENIGKQLALQDPENAGKYVVNTSNYIEKLSSLRNEMHKNLDSLALRDIVTFHEAFPYFAEEFGFNIAAVMVEEAGNGAEAGKLVEIVETVKSKSIKALFVEPQYQSQTAEIIAEETGAEIFVLDPVVTGEADGNYDAYIEKMNANMQVLMEALG